MTDAEQSKFQREKTATEFFREKFADADEVDTEPVWIDAKDDPEDLSKHCFVAGQVGDGKSTRLVGLLDDEDGEDGERETDHEESDNV